MLCQFQSFCHQFSFNQAKISMRVITTPSYFLYTINFYDLYQSISLHDGVSAEETVLYYLVRDIICKGLAKLNVDLSNNFFVIDLIGER